MRALWHTPLTQVRVVMLVQDPYHGEGQAEGLSFSVPEGVAVPPSLRNIFKELHADLGLQPPMSGSLLPWAKQGVLLLNACLTVEDGQAASHAGQGWELLTDAIIRKVAEQPQPVVFLLWGAHAQAKRPIIEAAQTQGGVTGQALMRELHARGSGLCQPDYVVDIPGGYAKARLREADIDEASRLRDAEGAWHDYRGA